MLNLDIPTGAVCAMISYRGCAWQFCTQKIPKKGVWFKPETWAAPWTERTGPSHVWIIPKMIYPSRTSLSLAGHFLFRSQCQGPKKDLHLINFFMLRVQTLGFHFSLSTHTSLWPTGQVLCSLSSTAVEHKLNTPEKSIFCLTRFLLNPTWKHFELDTD